MTQTPQQPGPPNTLAAADTLTRTATPEATQLALQAGWTMAVLYGNIPDPPAGARQQLPTVHELPQAERKALEVRRLGDLLQSLAALPVGSGSALPSDAGGRDAGQGSFSVQLEAVQ